MKTKYIINNIKKEFDNVSRILATVDDGKEHEEDLIEIDLEMDVNDKFLEFYSGGHTKRFELEILPDNSITCVEDMINDNDYTMHGTVFKKVNDFVLISNGGLLLKVKNDSIFIDDKVYTFITVL